MKALTLVQLRNSHFPKPNTRPQGAGETMGKQANRQTKAMGSVMRMCHKLVSSSEYWKLSRNAVRSHSRPRLSSDTRELQVLLYRKEQHLS